MVADLSWLGSARCSQIDPEIWIADVEGKVANSSLARSICNGTNTGYPCPVRLDCLRQRLMEPEHAPGVWAGMTSIQARRAWRMSRREGIDPETILELILG